MAENNTNETTVTIKGTDIPSLVGILVMQFSLTLWLGIMIRDHFKVKGTIGIVLIHMIKIVYNKLIMGDIMLILIYRSKKLLVMFTYLEKLVLFSEIISLVSCLAVA